MISNINLEKINNKIDNVQLNINRYNKYINNFQNGNNNNEIKKKYLNKINLKINNLNDHLNNIKKYNNNKDVQNIIIKGENIINKFNNLSGGSGNDSLLQEVLGHIKNPPKKTFEHLNKLINDIENSSRQELVKPKEGEQKQPEEKPLLDFTDLNNDNMKTIKLHEYMKYINKNSQNSQNIKDIFKYTIDTLVSFLASTKAQSLFSDKDSTFMYYLQSFIDIAGFMYYRRFPNFIQKINLVACILNGEEGNKYLTDEANIVESKNREGNKYVITDGKSIEDLVKQNLIFYSVFSELLNLYNLYDHKNGIMNKAANDYQRVLAKEILKLFNFSNMKELPQAIFKMLNICAVIMQGFSIYDEAKIVYDLEIKKYIAKDIDVAIETLFNT